MKQYMVSNYGRQSQPITTRVNTTWRISTALGVALEINIRSALCITHFFISPYKEPGSITQVISHPFIYICIFYMHICTLVYIYIYMIFLASFYICILIHIHIYVDSHIFIYISLNAFK